MASTVHLHVTEDGMALGDRMLKVRETQAIPIFGPKLQSPAQFQNLAGPRACFGIGAQELAKFGLALVQSEIRQHAPQGGCAAGIIGVLATHRQS